MPQEGLKILEHLWQPWKKGQVALFRVIFNFANLEFLLCGAYVQHRIGTSLIRF